MFGEDAVRLMYWPHVNRNIDPRIKALGKTADNIKLANEVLDDIHTFQWIVSLKSYEKYVITFEDKNLKNLINNEKERKALADFFAYISE